MTIQSAIDAHPEGVTFCIHRGTYRLTEPLQPKTGQRFIGVRRPIVSGARILSSFVRREPYWVAGGQTQEDSTNPQGVCRPTTYTGCQYAEGVFLGDRNLWQVTSLEELVPGSFYFDYAADEIYLADDPGGHTVEASVVSHAFASWPAKRVVLRGLVIEKFATPAKGSAVGGWAARNWLIEKNEVRWNHGIGICVGRGTEVRGNRVHDQGQMGVCGGGGRGIVFENNVVTHNNTEGFEWGWEAGGSKFIGSKGLLVRGNRFSHNVGTGLWTDTGNSGTRYIGNRIEHNAGAGIYHESSSSAVIRDNVIIGNGTGAGGWDRAGILIGTSTDVEIFDNVVKKNAGGIFAKQHGASPLISGLDVHDNVIVMCMGSTGLEVGQGIEADAVYSGKRNRFERNTYLVGADQTTWWRWRQEARTRAEWRQFGNDTKGRFGTTKC
jgi:parallel beta-helix repeat protein